MHSLTANLGCVPSPCVSTMGGPHYSASPCGSLAVSNGYLATMETPEVHSDEVYSMDYISDMKVADSANLMLDATGLLYLEDSWRTEWEKPIQVPLSLSLFFSLSLSPSVCQRQARP